MSEDNAAAAGAAPVTAAAGLVSVVIPCFNVAPYVAAALHSLGRQSYAHWQAIVVDDGSSDGTADIIAAAAAADGRVRLVRQSNQGVSAARNRALDVASGGSVLFLDADDWLAPDGLARMVSCLAAHPEAAAVYGAFCFVSEDGGQVVRRKTGPFPAGDIVDRLLVENLFANGGHLLIRSRTIKAAGRFRQDLRFGEDWEYWCRLALCGPVAVVPGDAPLLFVRQRSTGAYLRMATDMNAFTPCTDAIFANPELQRRLGDQRLQRLRTETRAENGWIVGREQVRHGDLASGLRNLRRSVWMRPRARRLLLLAMAHLSPLLPTRLTGPFRRYAGPA